MSRLPSPPPATIPNGMRPREGGVNPSKNQVTVAATGATKGATTAVQPTTEQIAQRAYALFEARGRLHGFDREDWAQAERELTLGRR